MKTRTKEKVELQSKEISKEGVDGASWFLLAACSKMQYEHVK